MWKRSCVSSTQLMVSVSRLSARSVGTDTQKHVNTHINTNTLRTDYYFTIARTQKRINTVSLEQE